jgi:hypothetical protein
LHDGETIMTVVANMMKTCASAPYCGHFSAQTS